MRTWAEVDKLLAELPDGARAAAQKELERHNRYIGDWGAAEAIAYVERLLADQKRQRAAPATAADPMADLQAYYALIDYAKAAGIPKADADALRRELGGDNVRALEELKKRTPATPPPAAPVLPTNGTARPAKKERKRNSPGFVKPRRAGKYIDPARGYFSMYNALVDTNLLAALPAPLLRAYVYSHRLANQDGTFAVSQGTVAQKIGAKDVRHGERVMKRLQAVGLVRLVTRGSAVTKTSNTYQLIPLADLDLTKVKAALAK
jgi:hypothetical protein